MLPAEAPCKFSENRCSTDQFCYKCILGVRWGWNWHDIGCQKGVLRGFLGVLGGFLGPFSGVLPRIGAPRGHLGGVLALRAPLWDGFGASGSPLGSFLKPPEALLAPFWGPPEAVLVPFWRLQKHSKLLSLALTQIPFAMIKKYAMHGEKRGRRNGRSPHESCIFC